MEKKQSTIPKSIATTNLNSNMHDASPSLKTASFYVEFVAPTLKDKYDQYSKQIMTVILIYLTLNTLSSLGGMLGFYLSNMRWQNEEYILVQHEPFDQSKSIHYLITNHKLWYSYAMNNIFAFPGFSKIGSQLMGFYVIYNQLPLISSSLTVTYKHYINYIKFFQIADAVIACLNFSTIWIIAWWFATDSNCCLFSLSCWFTVGMVLLSFVMMCYLITVIIISVYMLPKHLRRVPFTARLKHAGIQTAISMAEYYLQIFDKPIVIQILSLWVANLTIYFVIRNMLLLHLIINRNRHDLSEQFIFHHLFNANQCNDECQSIKELLEFIVVSIHWYII